jgi:hypothetical protein
VSQERIEETRARVERLKTPHRVKIDVSGAVDIAGLARIYAESPPDDFVDPPEPPQCPSTCYDRAASMDTRCRQPEGHEEPHGDGCMTWQDEEPCDAVDALQARIVAILKDRTTDSGVLNFALILDMAERAQDFEDDFSKVKAEKCAGDEVHCSCVIHLRRQIEELKAEVAALKSEAQNPYVLRIPDDAPRFWAKECEHLRTYRTEATVRVCRRCARVVEPTKSLPR